MTPSPDSVVAFEDNPVPSMAVGPIVEIAFHDFGEAVQSARETASARVVTIELVAEPADAAAQAQVDGDDDPAVPLPHTFVFTRDPNSPSAQLRFVVTAEGYVDAEVETPLAATDEPISVRLHRRGSDSPSGSRVLIPERSERNGRNPYER
jgi:hypothetical protein